MHSQLIAQSLSSWIWLITLSAAVSLALAFWGVVLLRVLPQLRINRHPVAFFCESLLYGVLIFSIAGLVGVLLGVRLYLTFVCFSAIAVLVAPLTLRRPTTGATLSKQPTSSTRDGRLLWLALLLVVGGSVLWSINNIEGISASDGGIVLVPWLDSFFHARNIGNFAQYQGDSGTLNSSMYGEPLMPYHYGSYVVSSLVSYLGNIPSIQIATSLYPVLGMLLTGASILVLANSTGGAGAALLAVTLLFFLPDPSCWIPGRTRWDSYFFFQQVGVGGSYAVAMMGLALAHALRAFQIGAWKLCVWGLCLFSLGILFKIQIVLAYSFFFVIFVIWKAPAISRQLRLFLAAAFVGVFCLAASTMSRIENAPTLAISTAGLGGYIDPIARLVHSGPAPLALKVALLPVAPIKLFLVTYGLLFPLSLYTAWRLRKVIAERTTVELLLLCLVSHACVRFLVADNQGYGDIAEINRKTLVWPYFVVVYCSAMLLWRYFSLAKVPLGLRRWVPAIAVFRG